MKMSRTLITFNEILLCEFDIRYKDMRCFFSIICIPALAHSIHFSGNFNGDVIIVKLWLSLICTYNLPGLKFLRPNTNRVNREFSDPDSVASRTDPTGSKRIPE
jgi:hypothetical protein